MCRSSSQSFVGVLSVILFLLAVSAPYPAYSLEPASVVAIAESKTPGSSETVQPCPTGNPGREATIPPAASKASLEDEEEEAEEQDIMESALALLDKSQQAWVKGDLETALDSLDQAYSLLLDTNGEPDIARQKDDLRLLIAKRILAIYTSMQSVTAGKRGEIPIVMNENVEREIRSFQTVERDFFIQSYQRSGLYRPYIIKELKKAGLPEELSWLPLVESGFKVCALSKARALGLWQFIPSTGYKYGMNRDEWIDERMDPEKSTAAAIGYLKDLHGMFGDWLTVLAAYNCGEGRVLKVISRQHLNYLDRFWDLYGQLPSETARYVPRFLATLHIIKDPKKYGIDLDKNVENQAPPAYEIAKTDKPMKLEDIAARLECQEETLVALNPELRYKATPDRGYNLRVPPKMGAKLAGAVTDIPVWEKPAPPPPPVRVARTPSRSRHSIHKVRRGETFASIARRYHVSVRELRQANKRSSRRGLRAGQYVSIPGRAYAGGRNSADADTSDNGVRKKGGTTTVRYAVKRGDTLSSVAREFNTTVSALKRSNKIKGNTLKAGQVIRIASTSEREEEAVNQVSRNGKKSRSRKGSRRADNNAGRTYIVKKGDTFSRIARKNNVSPQSLADRNGAFDRDKLRPGQVIVID